MIEISQLKLLIRLHKYQFHLLRYCLLISASAFKFYILFNFTNGVLNAVILCMSTIFFHIVTQTISIQKI